jgi:hypothetical protein
MTRIVTYAHRYKPPPRKRMVAALQPPVIARKKGKAHAVEPPDPVEEPVPAGEDQKPAIVTARRPGKPETRRATDVPEMTPEEHQRRGDAADALWRELTGGSTGEE